ncbi:hypothetical protein USB125703_01059 [Pseudoclavibacter triregionum]|nr:hypothetical protein USB125703_01059 [Pseudoclavibacter triregionum]
MTTAAPAPAPLAGFRSGSPFRPGLSTFATFALFTAFAGDFWRNLLSWWGFGAIVVGIAAVAVVLLVRKRPLPRLTHLPAPLVLFLLWCLLSTIWSWYRPETLLACLIQLIGATVALSLAVNCTKLQFLDALGRALRIIVGMSLVFELLVALFMPHGILPLYLYLPGQLELFTGIAGATPETAHPAVYWSQGHLFDGAAIQGILGNRNLLGFVALLALIVTGVQLAAGRLGRWRAWIWCLVCFGTLFLSRSATPIVALPVIALAIALVWLARRLSTKGRWIMYVVVFALGCIGAFVLVTWRDEIFGLINRSGDMSGRGDVWRAVVGIGSQQPILGVGWISYWAPWVSPYKDLVILDGLRYLQAHNAYLDAWMQTGVIGAALLGGLVLSTTIRSWWLAIDRPQTDASGSRPIPHTAVLAFLLMVALVLQSLTESRLLVEGNWVLLCYLAIYSKLRVQDLPALPRRTIPARTGPIALPGVVPGEAAPQADRRAAPHPAEPGAGAGAPSERR